MTPESIRTISQLRQQFYTLFTAAMQVPVNVTNQTSYAGNTSMASWVDSWQRLNYMCVYAYTAPDELLPERPFILRISINKGVDASAVARYGKSYQNLNRSQWFELTVLPDEILDFLPWIVSLVEAYGEDQTRFTLEPPHPLDGGSSERSSEQWSKEQAWTQAASRKLSQPLLPA